MIYRVIFSVVFIFLFLAGNCFPQEATFGLPFLTISPYTETNGMGTASVANCTDDPLSVMTNPAHLGMFSENQFISSGYNFSYWLPGYRIPDRWYQTFAINTGLPLNKISESAPPLSVGFGYSSVYLNVGKIIITKDSPEPIPPIYPYERSDQFSFGVGLDYCLKIFLGYTHKHITSSLPLDITGQRQEGDANVNAFDLGLLVDIPVIDIISKLQGKPVVIFHNTTPFFDLNVGIAQNNLGSSRVVYDDPARPVPLPRTARAGLGLNLGINYSKEEIVIKPISFKWTIEASAELIKSHSDTYDTTFDNEGNIIRINDVQANWQYQSGLGDIKFLDEVILGKGNAQTMKAKGWEVNFLELFFLRGGRFEEDPTLGDQRFSTTGWGLRLSGLIKCLRILNVTPDDKTIPGLILNHIDFRNDHSSWTTDDPKNPLNGTKFNSSMFYILL